MSRHLTAGHRVPTFESANIHGTAVRVPDSRPRLIHLQFRRFAGCAMCNLHLQSFVERHDQIKSYGIKEIVVFHSTEDELMPFQGYFPFDVIADPSKRLYKLYGVDQSIVSILHPAVIQPLLESVMVKNKPAPKMPQNGGILGLPADFAILPSGSLAACRYGRHAYDHWTVENVLDIANIPANERQTTAPSSRY